MQVESPISTDKHFQGDNRRFQRDTHIERDRERQRDRETKREKERERKRERKRDKLVAESYRFV